MDELQKLYGVLSDKGYYTKSFDEFSKQIEDDSYKQKVYDVVSKDGLYTKDYDSFSSKYYAEDVKKKDDFTLGPTDMDLPSEEASSDISPEISKEYEKSSFQAKDYLGEFLGGAIDAGVRQGKTAEETMELIYQGKDVSEEDLQEYVAAVRRMQEDGPSKDMIEFQKIAEENGGGFMGFITALGSGETSVRAASEVALTSFAGMITAGIDAKEELAAGTGAVAATGATLGAVAGGGIFTPVTASAGAVSGSIAGAMGAAGGLLETSMSYTEFLKEELEKRDLEFNPENIRTVLNDDEARGSIRNRALTRGAVVGIVDAMSAGLAGAAAKGVTKTVGSAATTAGRMIKKGSAVATAGAIESVGGGVGEATARLAAGQEMDAIDIGFEIIGGAPKGLLTGPIGILRAGKQSGYSINGEVVTKDVMSNVLKTATPEQLSEMKVSIQNDDVASSILKAKQDRYNVEQNLPDDIPESNIEEVIDLEIKKKNLEGKNSVSAKNRIKEIEKKIVEKSQPVEQEQVVEQEQAVKQEQTIEQEQTVEQEQAVEEEQIAEQETTIEDVQSAEIDYSTKTTSISRVDETGKFVGAFDKKTGREIKTKRAVQEHQDNLIKQKDYTTGKSAFDGIPEGTVSGNPNETIATDSENPQEIARAYEQEKQSVATDIDPVVDAFVGMYKVDGKTLDRYYGSKDDLGQLLSYVRGKKGEKGMPLDVIAQEVSGTVGFEVSPQQLFDIMMDPKYKSNRPPTQSNLTTSLKNRFIEVTGLNGTDSQIKAVAEQDPSQLSDPVLSQKEQRKEDLKRAKEEQEFAESQEEQKPDAQPEDNRTRLEKLVADTKLEPVVKSIQDKLRTFYKTHLSAKGYMTEEMNRYREIRNGGFARDLGRVKRSAKQFNRLTKGMTDEQKAQVMEDLNDILHGRVDKEDSPLMSTEKGQKIAEIGQRMRAEIDALSYRLADTGLLSEESNQNILNNVGAYVNRSYRLFETADWKDNVKEEVVEAARVYIKNNLKKLRFEAEKRAGVREQVKEGKKAGMPVESLLTDKQLQEIDTLHDRLVEEEIEKILNKSDQSKYRDFIKGASDARAALSRGVLEQRNDGIPLEIQDLMGRIDNPLDNYLNTIKKLSILVNNTEFQANLLQMGGAGIFSNKQVGEFTTLVAKDSNTYPFLEGMYARPEIAALFQGKEQGRDMLSNILLSNNDLIVQIGGTIKGLKTVGSIGTHFKNLLGNLGFVVLNGHYNIKEFQKAGDIAFRGVAERLNTEEKVALMDEYRALGLIGQNVTLGDVRTMFGSESFEQAMESAVNDPKRNVENKRTKAFKKLLAGTKKKFGGTIEAFENAYQAEDDLFKIVAYEVEKSRYAEAMFDTSYNTLSEQQKQEVNNIVVEIVKNTYPTYDRVGSLFKKIGKSPLIGAFISFQAESVRTMVNSYRIAKQQLNSDNAKIRMLGTNRMMSFSAYFGLQSAINLGLMQAGKTAIGLAFEAFGSEDEEDPVDYDDMRKFMPGWSKNSNISVFETGAPGVYNVLDLSANNPHSLIMDVMKAGTQDSGKNHFVEAVRAALEPFLGQDMIAATVNELGTAISNDGITSKGKRIYNPEDSDEVAVSKMAMHVGKLFLPGTVTSAIRLGEGVAGVNDRDAANEMLGLIGFRPYKVDIRKQLKFKLYKYKGEINEYKSSYSRSQRKGVDNYDSINEAMKEANSEMHELIMSATRLGLDVNQINSILKETRIGKSEMTQLMTGAIFDYIPRR